MSTLKVNTLKFTNINIFLTELIRFFMMHRPQVATCLFTKGQL